MPRFTFSFSKKHERWQSPTYVLKYDGVELGYVATHHRKFWYWVFDGKAFSANLPTVNSLWSAHTGKHTFDTLAEAKADLLAYAKTQVESWANRPQKPAN